MSNLEHEGAIEDGGVHAPNTLRKDPSPAGVHVGEEELLEAPPGLRLRAAEAVEPGKKVHCLVKYVSISFV